MSDRDDIFNRLRSQARAASPPEPWRSRRDFDDLAARFAASSTKVAGEVHRAANLDEALTSLGDLLAELQARRVAVNAEPPLDGIDLAGRWPQVEWCSAAEASGDELRAFCAAADAGITGADGALAETGTVVVSSGPGKSRLVSLLPPVHIVLLPTSRLTADLFTWTAARGGEPMPSSVTLISGPSKTADIEQVMAVGVHGPKRFIAILYED